MLLENFKINYKPLVLVNTLFDIVSYKTDIEGYWVNKGKLYIDNIKLIDFPFVRKFEFDLRIRLLFDNGERAIFYKNYFNEGCIIYPSGKIEVLKNRTAWIENKKPSQSYIKELLNNNNGLTIYKIGIKKYLIEIYK